jgi:hypothetical protein
MTILFIGHLSRAQDQIYKSDNSKVLVRIIEIGPEEVKYKLFENPNGPVYTESKANIQMIVYENGKHEVISSGAAPVTSSTVVTKQYVYTQNRMTLQDSLIYFKHSENISVNFLYFFNNEIGILYQKEFFKSQFNIMIPLAVGVEVPNVTESVYFSGSNSSFSLTRKMFEVGFGINYYPTLRTNSNYFIGPMFRYMQYNGVHNFRQTYFPGMPYSQNATLRRYTLGITNGFMIRTRSRLAVSIYCSLGFKNDVADNMVQDPRNGNVYSGILKPVSFYAWTGFNVGFCF